MLKGGYFTTSQDVLDYEEAVRIAAAADLSQVGDGETVPCQLCLNDLGHLSAEDRQLHYDEHFSDSSAHGQHGMSTSKQSSNMGAQSTAAHKAFPPKENAFWYPACEDPPPPNFTIGLIPVLRKSLNSSHAKGNTLKAALCYDRTVHIATQLWDLGWGCGYRNFLMACTALMDQKIQPMYFPLLDGSQPPGVRNLQGWIEEAWSQGFDQEGAAQLKHHLTRTRKWIGTGELCVAFNYKGVPAQLVDFDLSRNGVQTVIDWVVEYFAGPEARRGTVDDALRGASPVICTNRMPLVLQHAGHSRTIIGYEQTKSGTNLLLFDPSKKPNAELRQAALAAACQPLAPPSKLSLKTHHPTSASRLLHKIAHPLRHKKRKQNENDPSSSADRPAPPKRRRSVDPHAVTDDEDMIVVDEPSTADTDGASRRHQSSLQPSKVLSFFRLNPKQLGRKDKYQILYFPLTEPLTDEERFALRVLKSEKVQ